jgi:putative flippase GtrA
MQRDLSQIVRYGVNGVVATGVHYGVLVLLLEQLQVRSAGVANLAAAGFGISASFLGNRYFVFGQTQSALLRQAWRFSLLYGVIAFIHGGILFLWTDLYQLDYRAGFLVATFFQFVFSYVGNRFLVFR